MRQLLLPLALLCLFAPAASAEAPFQLAVAGAQAPEDPDVNGFRLGIFHAANRTVRGLDIGLASLNETTTASGVSLIFGLGRVTGPSSGLASSIINIHTGEDRGMNAAFVNSVKTMKSGVNMAFINVTEGFSNVDISGIAISDQSTVQVGFINVTRKLDGLQIGFLNFAENGFFPVFPIFNFPTK